jgi:hypothetical protein
MVSGWDQTATDPVENKSIQHFALLGAGQAGKSDRAGRPGRKMAALSRTVPSHQAGGQRKVLSEIHPHQLGREEKKQGSVQLAPLDGRRSLQQRAKIETEDVDDLHLCLVCPNRTQGLEMPFAGLGGQDEEFSNACPLLPRLDKFVHHPVKRSAPQRGPARKRAGGGVHTILDRRGASDAERLGEVVCQALHDDCIAPQR